MSNLRLQEGALLLGTERPSNLLIRPHNKPIPNIWTENSVDFSSFSICGPQTGPKAISKVAKYYQMMLSLIEMPALSEAASMVNKVMGGEDESTNHDVARMYGIISSVPDLLVQIETQRWEMVPIDDIHSLDSIADAVSTLMAPSSVDSNVTVGLFPRNVQRFTGIYPGAVVGILGRPFTFDIGGTPTTVGLSNIFTPSRPLLQWVKSPLSASGTSHKDVVVKTPLRLHFYAGPFLPNTFSPISMAIKSAVSRGANAIVICGPFIKDSSADQDLLLNNDIQTLTFEDRINSLCDVIEGELGSLTPAQQKVLRSVILVPSVEDVESIPVIPQVCLPVNCDEGSQVRCECVSNPVTIMIDSGVSESPLKIKVCNYPAVDRVAETMSERWTDRIRRLERSAEAVVQSRLLVPLIDFPAANHDLTALERMYIFDSDESRETDSVEPSLEPETSKSPHLIVSTTSRAQSFLATTHSKSSDTSNTQGDNIVFIALGTGNRTLSLERKFMFQGVEVTIPDIEKAATEGLCSSSSVMVLNIDGTID